MHFRLALLCAGLGAPVLAESPAVATDMPVVHSLTAQVMGAVGEPSLLLDQGADPHSFQLRPSQAWALSEAELVFWVGPELTPWMARALEGIGTQGDVVTLLRAEGLHLRDYAQGHAEAGHHGHAEAHDHGHGHSREGLDPHVWLDPHNASTWVDVIAAELAAHDPANADTYRDNAMGAKARIDALESEVQVILAPVGARPLVMFHDAYGYFANHFGLNSAGTITLGDAVAPGAARLAELRRMLVAEPDVCVFPEAAHPPRQVEILVEGTGARIGAALDPEGTMLEPGPALYEALMIGLARDIAACAEG